MRLIAELPPCASCRNFESLEGSEDEDASSESVGDYIDCRGWHYSSR
jgi:hypothetical protein